jgi:hypothetical protein
MWPFGSKEPSGVAPRGFVEARSDSVLGNMDAERSAKLNPIANKLISEQLMDEFITSIPATETFKDLRKKLNSPEYRVEYCGHYPPGYQYKRCSDNNETIRDKRLNMIKERADLKSNIQKFVTLKEGDIADLKAHGADVSELQTQLKQFQDLVKGGKRTRRRSTRYTRRRKH